MTQEEIAQQYAGLSKQRLLEHEYRLRERAANLQAGIRGIEERCRPFHDQKEELAEARRTVMRDLDVLQQLIQDAFEAQAHE